MPQSKPEVTVAAITQSNGRFLVVEERINHRLVFNQPAVAPFRDKLRAAGFYNEWKGKYGDKAWELLEKSVGKLS